MLPKKKISILILFIFILSLLSYTIYNEVALKPFNFEEVEGNIYRFQTYDAELNEAIVLAQNGLLEQYDSINRSVSSLQKRVVALQNISSHIKNAQLHYLSSKLKSALDSKVSLVEQFKQDNTTLNIAVLQFSKTLSSIIESQTHEEVVESCLSGQFSYELTDLTNSLYRDMLVYVNTTKPSLKPSLITNVQKIRALQEASPELLKGLVYADLILENEPKVDDLTKKIFDANTIDALGNLNTEFRKEFDAYLKQANINRILLYFFSAILLCLLIWAFRQIQSTIQQLRLAQEDLRIVNQGLENRVKERTQQLTDKNKDLQKTLKKLSATQEQLVLNEKMASVGMLTAGISHELKNPLNFVNNFSEASVDLIKELQGDLAQYYQTPTEKTKTNINEIVIDLATNTDKVLEHGKRADKIIENMRLHSQATPASKESTDLNKLIEEQIDLAYHNILAKNKDFNIKIVKHLDDQAGKITLIPQTMSRAILNILMNAMYYLQKKETLHPDGFTPELIVSTQRQANKIVLTIHDNGIGIPQSNIRKVFEPFFTTKPTGEGTGLGLSIAYDTITKEHGGDIRVHSQEGEYTEFVIELPCKKETT